MTDHYISGMTGVVLAGGQSRRMGGEKAFLPWRGRPLISYPLQLLSGLFREVLIVSRDPAAFAGLGVPVHGDRFAERAALVGLHAGLHAASEPLAFVAACDMPCIREATARLIAGALTGGAWAAVPTTRAGTEPLLAVYDKRCLPVMERLIGAGDLRISSLFREVPVTFIPAVRLEESDPDLRSFLNLNTPEELMRAAAETGGGDG